MKLQREAFRTRRNYLLGVASELGRPLLRSLSSFAASGKPTPPAAWRRGLILGHNHIGDVLYRTCSLSALAEGLPNCQWDYLAGPVSAAVLRGNPFVHRVFPDQLGDDVWSLAPGAFTRLREVGYDVVLCTNVVRYYPDLLLATALRVPNRVAFTLKGLSGVGTFPIPAQFPQSYPGYFRSMVAAVTGKSPSWSLRPDVYPDAEDAAAADIAWSAVSSTTDKVVAASITTRQPGAWPRNHFLRALEIVHRETGAQIVLFGAPDEMPLLFAAASECQAPCIVLQAGLNLRALSVFLGKCSAVLTPDSGPRHLANASRAPVVFARSLIVRRVETGAYCDTELDAGPDDELVPSECVGDVIARLDPARTATLVIQAMRSTRNRGG